MSLPKEVKRVVPPSGPYLLCSHECQLTKAASFELWKLFFSWKGPLVGHSMHFSL